MAAEESRHRRRATLVGYVLHVEPGGLREHQQRGMVEAAGAGGTVSVFAGIGLHLGHEIFQRLPRRVALHRQQVALAVELDDRREVGADVVGQLLVVADRSALAAARNEQGVAVRRRVADILDRKSVVVGKSVSVSVEFGGTGIIKKKK